MKFRMRKLIGISTVASFAFAGTAYALTIDPTSGPPDSHYQVQVPCDSTPKIYVADLYPGPPGTLLPRVGTETSPGVWTYDVQARLVDQVIRASCGGAGETARYDVVNPMLMPNPTVLDYGDFTYGAFGNVVSGTDCRPGSAVSITITGPGGFSSDQSTTADSIGSWQIPVPGDAPSGDLTANASCGEVRYDPLTFQHRGSAVSTSLPEDRDAATPVAGTPSYTG